MYVCACACVCACGCRSVFVYVCAYVGVRACAFNLHATAMLLALLIGAARPAALVQEGRSNNHSAVMKGNRGLLRILQLIHRGVDMANPLMQPSAKLRDVRDGDLPNEQSLIQKHNHNSDDS